MDAQILEEIRKLRSQIFQLESRVDFLYKKLNVEYVEGSDGVDPRLAKALKSGNKIEAIKVYRELTNCGLAEAKSAVEAMWRE
jgi:hypothetical protein